MKRERKIKRKSFSIKRAAQKTQDRRGTLDNQTSSQVNLRVAVSQMNFVVGDFEYNVNRIKNCLKDATKFGADLVLFPELTLTGYPPEDLLLKDDFIAKNKKLLRHLALGVRGIVAIVGYVEKVKRSLYNSAALLYKGKVVGNYRKMILPNYGVFDEKRYFVEGDEPTCFVMNGIKIGLAIHVPDIFANG
jgi:NAD+ synthase (glutamine-hydrolysing)